MEKKETIHYSRSGYNGDFTYTSVCGKKVHSHSDDEKVHTSPEEANCKKCLASAAHKTDLTDSIGKTKTTIKRRIFIESDILQADEFSSAQREVHGLVKDKKMNCVDRVFSQVLDHAWHHLEKTWEAVKRADEIYASSSLIPLIGNSYTGAPVIFNGMCERAIKEKVTGKSVYILNSLKNIDWDMIDLDVMKKAFKENTFYTYDNDYDKIIKVDVNKIKKR